MKMHTVSRPLRALSSLALGLALWSSSAPSAALEPAGGSPEPAAAEPAGERDASVEEAPADLPATSSAPRSWLARGGDPVAAATPAQSTSSGAGTGFTLAAAVLVLGLGAAAVVMRMKRQKASPLAPSESRLTVLSSSRVGPKAFAVTAHVNGRVLLLGVTDHTVTNLGWLDAPEAVVAAAPEEALGGPAETDEELPDDYPGSALRAVRPPAAFASSSHLKRFEEVLRGAAQARPELPMRPSYQPPAEDAATLLAAQTTDVLAATPAPAPAGSPRAAATATATATAVSLRRKRRARESLPPRDPRDVQPRVAAARPAPRAPEASVEGQVAGLRALRNGG